MSIQLAYNILYVSDVEKAMSFYSAALGFAQKFLTPEKDYGELLTGSTTLAFAVYELAESNLAKGYQKASPTHKPFAMELGFTTDNVEATLSAILKAGGTIEEAAKTKPWGQVVAYARDLDGFLLEICTPMGN